MGGLTHGTCYSKFTYLLRECIKLMTTVHFKFTEHNHLEVSNNDVKNKKYIFGHILPIIENIEKIKERNEKTCNNTVVS